REGESHFFPLENLWRQTIAEGLAQPKLAGAMESFFFAGYSQKERGKQMIGEWNPQFERMRHTHLIAVAQQGIGHIRPGFEQGYLVQPVQGAGLVEDILQPFSGEAIGFGLACSASADLPDLSGEKQRPLQEVRVLRRLGQIDAKFLSAGCAVSGEDMAGKTRQSRHPPGYPSQLFEQRRPAERAVA